MTAADFQKDYQTILALGLDFAERQLTEHAAFFPFAFTIDADGNPAPVDSDEDDPDDAAALITGFEEFLREQAAAGAIRATGVFAAVQVRTKKEQERKAAVRVSLEHTDAQPMQVFVPYVLVEGEGEKEGSVEYGDAMSIEVNGCIFVDDEDGEEGEEGGPG